MKKYLITCLLASAALTVSAQDLTFDSLTVAALNGQDGWTDASGLASVVAAPVGMSGNALRLNGSPATSMNTFATRAFTGPLYSTISFDVSIAAGIPTDPAELFLRLNSWSNYIAVKADTGVLEVTGGSLTGLTIPTSTVFNLAAVYNVSGGVASSVEMFINGGSVGTITGLSTAFTSANIELRSQKVESYVDNLSVPEPSTYAAILGLMALGFVAWRRRK